jgi:Tfp pilus assembly protein PilZ
MAKSTWYVHIQGENIGPLSTANVSSMLQQNRLQFVDFIWAESLTKWHRIMDLDQFASLLPQYPKVGIPAVAVEERVETPARKPSPAKEAPVKSPTKKPALGKFQRVRGLGAKVQIEEHGSFNVVNMSEGGIFLESKQPPFVGTEVTLSLELPSVEKKLDLTGVVIRHGIAEEIVGFAVEFTRLNPAHKRVLRDFIAERIKEK